MKMAPAITIRFISSTPRYFQTTTISEGEWMTTIRISVMAIVVMGCP